MNKLLSKIAMCLIIIQHLSIISLITNLKIRYVMFSLYLFFIINFIIYYSYTNNTYQFNTYIANNGHLSWDWMNYKGYENIWIFIWLLFYIIPAFTINNFLLSLFILVSLFVSLFFYFKQNTFGTMWCWSSNLFLIYFVIDILLIKPFCEYNSLC